MRIVRYITTPLIIMVEERRTSMQNKEEMIEKITKLLEKLKYTELLAIYRAICKLNGLKA